jgi:hypothetical protein
MRFKQYDNDTRFWLFNTTLGRWVLRIGLAVVFVLVLLKILGFD